jgi:hypothetical protein
MNQAYMGIGVSAVATFPITILVFVGALISGGTFGESVVLLFSWGFFSFISALVVSAIYGAPIYLLLKKASYVKLPILVIVGLIGGAVFNSWAFPASGTEAYITLAVIGAYCSFAFWYGAEKISVNK